jgi:hypothetical protein
MQPDKAKRKKPNLSSDLFPSVCCCIRVSRNWDKSNSVVSMKSEKVKIENKIFKSCFQIS